MIVCNSKYFAVFIFLESHILKTQNNLDVMAIITTVMYKYIINIITLANDLLSTCFTKWMIQPIIISVLYRYSFVISPVGFPVHAIRTKDAK